MTLPTFEQVRANAYRELADVLDGMRSDTRGPRPTRTQAEAMRDARRHILRAREALNAAAPT